MSSYVKAIPGQVGYPSLQILESQFVCHDGQDLSVAGRRLNTKAGSLIQHKLYSNTRDFHFATDTTQLKTKKKTKIPLSRQAHVAHSNMM